jgi:hypothetical protein
MTDIGLHGGIDATQVRVFPSARNTDSFTTAAIYAAGTRVVLFLHPSEYAQAVAMLRGLADGIESGAATEAKGYYSAGKWVAS